MHHIILWYVRLLGGERGEFRGWRIFAAIAGAGLLMVLLVRSQVGWKKNAVAPFGVLLGIFTLAGALFWGADAWRTRVLNKALRDGKPAVPPAWLDSRASVRSATLIGCLIGIVLIPVCAFVGGKLMWHDYASRWWPAVPCIAKSVDDDFMNGSYVVKVHVYYDVKEQRIGASLSAHKDRKVTSVAEVQRLKSLYAPGTRHIVYVDPSDPTRAALQRGPGIGTIIASISMPIISTLMFIAAVRGLIHCCHRPRREEFALNDMP